MPACLPEVALAQEDPVRQVDLGIHADRLVDAEGQRLPLACPQPVRERAEQRDHAHLAGNVVGLPHLRRDGRRVVAARRIGVVATVHHDAAQRQMNEIAALEVGPRAGIAERADPQTDQPWIGRTQPVEGEVPVGKIPARARIQHDVGGGRELQERLLPVRLVEIDDDAALAEVVVPEMQALLRRRHIPRNGPMRRVASPSGGLGLDGVGAQAGEHPTGVFACLVGKLEHPDAVKIRTRHALDLPPTFVCPAMSPASRPGDKGQGKHGSSRLGARRAHHFWSRRNPAASMKRRYFTTSVARTWASSVGVPDIFSEESRYLSTAPLL